MVDGWRRGGAAHDSVVFPLCNVSMLSIFVSSAKKKNFFFIGTVEKQRPSRVSKVVAQLLGQFQREEIENTDGV